jgi:uncharacterized membrane protein YdjX (TVP38/TMEM64 family)
LALLLLFALLHLTPIGRQMRAIADNPDLARACGIRSGKVLLALWAVVGALCALGGMMFGPYVGALAQASGATLGSVVIYMVYRTSIGTWLRAKFEADAGFMDRLAKGIDRNAFTTLFTLRVIPSVPFVLVNATAGMMAVPLRPYVIATFIGLLPSTFIYTWIGSQLGDLLRAGVRPDLPMLLHQFFWPLMGVAFLSLLLPIGIKLVQMIRARRARSQGGAAPA